MRNRRYNYRPTKIGAIKYRTATAAIKYLLTRTKLTQSAIARRVGVSTACVCQLASSKR